MNKDVLITHVFDAPRELVFKAWTDAEWLAKWYAPDNCTVYFKHIDVQEGGTFLSCIYNPQYGNCWAMGKYLEIKSPHRIQYTLAVADESGNPSNAVDEGMNPEWPQETIVTVTFTELDGKTKMVLHQTVSEALAKQTGAYPSWLQMFNRLNKLLS